MKDRIHIRCYASLRSLAPPTADEHPITAGTTVAALIRDLGIAPDQIKLAFVNGRRADLDRTLNHGDRVGLFPPVGGG